MQINRLLDEQVKNRLSDENFVVNNQDVMNFYLEDDGPFVHGASNTITPNNVEYGDMLLDDHPERDDMPDELLDK
jgi:hypothetical protein